MIKLCLILLIIICLIVLISSRSENFDATSASTLEVRKCNSNKMPTEQLLINGGLLDNKMVIYWNLPKPILPSQTPVYHIIYKKESISDDTQFENKESISDDKQFENNVIEITSNQNGNNLYSYTFPSDIIPTDIESYSVTLNITIDNMETGETVSSNTLRINKTNSNNETIKYLQNPDDIFSSLKSKSIDIYI
jgi:hypothetical protein